MFDIVFILKSQGGIVLLQLLARLSSSEPVSITHCRKHCIFSFITFNPNISQTTHWKILLFHLINFSRLTLWQKPVQVPSKTLVRLQYVYNSPARVLVVVLTRLWQHICLSLIQIHWLPVKFCIHFENTTLPPLLLCSSITWVTFTTCPRTLGLLTMTCSLFLTPDFELSVTELSVLQSQTSRMLSWQTFIARHPWMSFKKSTNIIYLLHSTIHHSSASPQDSFQWFVVCFSLVQSSLLNVQGSHDRSFIHY